MQPNALASLPRPGLRTPRLVRALEHLSLAMSRKRRATDGGAPFKVIVWCDVRLLDDTELDELFRSSSDEASRPKPTPPGLCNVACSGSHGGLGYGQDGLLADVTAQGGMSHAAAAASSRAWACSTPTRLRSRPRSMHRLSCLSQRTGVVQLGGTSCMWAKALLGRCCRLRLVHLLILVGQLPGPAHPSDLVSGSTA